jgi:hypothetical protein
MAKSLKRGKVSRKSLRKGRKSLRRGKGFRKNVKIYGGGETTELHKLVTGEPDDVVNNLNKIRDLKKNDVDNFLKIINAADEDIKTPLDIILSNTPVNIVKMSPVIIYLLQSGAEHNKFMIETKVEKYINKMKDNIYELITTEDGTVFINRQRK